MGSFSSFQIGGSIRGRVVLFHNRCKATPTMTHTTRTLGAAACLLLCGATFHPSLSYAEEPDLEGKLGLDRMEAWFEANPDLKTTKSSGWKPFNRAKWLEESRPTPAGTSAGQLRLEAFQIAKERAPLSAERGDPGWFNIGPTEYSGRCLTVDFDPNDANIVYVGSASGGLWKSTDGGDTWSTSTDDLPTLAVGAVCVLGWNSDVVLMGTGEGTGVGFVTSGKGIFGNGLLKSTDAGASWQSTSLSYNIPSNHGFNVIEDNPSTQTILAGANDGLWRSTDEGETWTQVLSGGNFFDVKWQPGSSSRVYVVKGRDPFFNFPGDAGVWVSEDDGLTFVRAGSGQPNGTQIAKTKIAVTPDNPDYIYAHYIRTSGWSTLGLYRSTDGGQTWEARNTSVNMAGGQGWYNNVLIADPNDADRLVAGGNVLYVSDDGGTSLNDLNGAIPFGDGIAPHWDNHGIAYEPGSNSTLWLTTDGGPWRSTDDGATWTRRTEGIVTYQFYDIGVAQADPLFIMGGTQDNGMPGRADEDTWFQSTFVADGFVCNIDPFDSEVVYSEWQGGNHIKSLDGGQSWFSIQGGISGGGAWLTPVDMDQDDPNHLYTESSQGIYRMTNGTSWSRVGTQDARWISMNPSDGDIVWTVSNSEGVWYTTNDGASWNPSLTFPANGLEIKIQADPHNLSSAFVVFGGYGTGGPHIVRTTDFGLTWEDVTGDFPDQPANTFIVDPQFPDDWYVGSDVGVWKSTNGGVNWIPFGAGLANVVVADLEIRREARKLVAGTYGRGVWEADISLDPASVETGETASRNLMLDPPYPNPVGDRTVFRFAARTTAPARLDIFDVSGRKVSTVVEGSRGDGLVRMVSWSPEDLSDGVYLAILRAGDAKATQKVIVRN